MSTSPEALDALRLATLAASPSLSFQEVEDRVSRFAAQAEFVQAQSDFAAAQAAKTAAEDAAYAARTAAFYTDQSGAAANAATDTAAGTSSADILASLQEALEADPAANPWR